ncbi:hypothetical protein JHK86_048618 [Glycine max]|nr:hypothetical protein JHK86_048618 [Glycine max]
MVELLVAVAVYRPSIFSTIVELLHLSLSNYTMTNLKLVFTISSILLALVFINGISSVMGRPLKKEHIITTTYENSVKEMGTVEDNNILLWRRSIIENAANDGGVDKWIDDFRPTDPGHSPGAGHSSPTPKDASNGAPRP